MGLEHLKSAFNEISKNSIDPIDNANSPVSDKSQEANSFTSLPIPTVDSDFANQSIKLTGGKTILGDMKHSFGTNGANEKLVKINNILIRQEDSPQTKQERIEITAEEIKINQVSETEEGGLFQNLGVNNQLGRSPFNWRSLYNSNHTPIEERTPIDTGRVDKDGNPILINTLRSGMGALSQLDIKGYSSDKLDNFRGFNRGNEPYIVKSIGSKDYTIGVNREGLNINRTLDDTSRLLQFYGTGAGLSFIAKENVINYAIGTSNQPFHTDNITFPPVANPLQGNTSFLNVTNLYIQDLGGHIASLRKPLTIEYSSRKTVGLPFKDLNDHSRLSNLFLTTPFYDLSGFGDTRVVDVFGESGIQDAFDPNKGGSGIFNAGGDAPLENSNATGVPQIFEEDGDFYVRFKDIRNNKFIYFRGYVTGITENVNPSWTPTNYIGRSEAVYNYERAERDLSFNLRVLPANKNQFEKMWEKINYLTSLAYPEYIQDDDVGFRMKAPFTELYMGHIGTPAKGQFGFIKSISYTVNESGDWDSVNKLPRVLDVAISYQIVNKKPPSLYQSLDVKTIDNLTEFYKLPK